MTRCNFLDITLDLTNKCHMPYEKNSSIKYINKSSNHLTIIKNNLPKMVEERLIRLSTDPNIFDDAKPCYQNALSKSNLKHKLKYTHKTKLNDKKETKKNKKCDVRQPPVLPIDKNKNWQTISAVNRQTFQKREHEKKYSTEITVKYLTAAWKT